MNTDCLKCRAPMKPLPGIKSRFAIDCAPMKITGYRCDCGHWNSLKRRRGFKIAQQDEAAIRAELLRIRNVMKDRP